MAKEVVGKKIPIDAYKQSQSTTNFGSNVGVNTKTNGRKTNTNLAETNEPQLYSMVISLVEENVKLNNRLEQCERKLQIIENNNQNENVERMCKSISSLSNLFYKVIIGTVLFVIGFALVVFRLTRDGLSFDITVAIVGLFGVFSFVSIWNIPKKIEELERDISDLRTQLK